MIDAGNPDDPPYDLARPEAASLVESLRAFGYELATAIADLVDNSLTAKAKHVWIDFHWAGDASVILVTDDGNGMTEKRLVSAMRPGSQNPLSARSPADLGRFGLGLKTASFSQCRRVTVLTKVASGESNVRCWDLDHIARVNDWQLLKHADAASELHFKRVRALPHGTCVLWQKLDRLVQDTAASDGKQQQHFLKRAEMVQNHLGMVFHRLMERNGTEILINGSRIAPWDPFLDNEAATQPLSTTPLLFKGGQVDVRPYVLPHHSKIGKSVHDAAAGPRGWNAHQGFFIYRNKRLIVPGDWLGFGWAKEEHYKLARIRVDVPTSLDLDWGIDVTKSKASPPAALREDLRRIGERARSQAKRIYSHRGTRLTSVNESERTFLWQPLAKHDKTFYRINREHPLVHLASDSATDKRAYNALLRLIEETVPLAHITITNTEHPNSLAAPFERTAESQVIEIMRQTYRSLMDSGYDPQSAVDRMKTIWPFELFPALLESLKEASFHAE